MLLFKKMKFLYLLIFLFLSCEKEVQKGRSISEYIDNVLYGDPIRIEISENNKISIKISSDTLFQHNDGNTILFGNVYADLFDEDGLKVSEVHSDSAIVFKDSDSLKAIGDVLVHSTKGLKLFSEELILFNNTKLVKSNNDIIFTSNDGDTLYGVGFWSNFDMTNYQIEKPKGTLNKIE